MRTRRLRLLVAMHHAGALDKEVSSRLGVAPGTVTRNRNLLGLPPNAECGRCGIRFEGRPGTAQKLCGGCYADRVVEQRLHGLVYIQTKALGANIRTNEALAPGSMVSLRPGMERDLGAEWVDRRLGWAFESAVES